VDEEIEPADELLEDDPGVSGFWERLAQKPLPLCHFCANPIERGKSQVIVLPGRTGMGYVCREVVDCSARRRRRNFRVLPGGKSKTAATQGAEVRLGSGPATNRSA
jgi:hypothetical protein